MILSMLALAMLAEQVPAAAAPTTVQQQFDAASAALNASDWAGALQRYEALEQRLSKSKNRRSLAIVRLRKGEALDRLGRKAEAAEALRAGLAETPANDPSLAEDRQQALLRLAGAEEAELDYPSAYAHYEQARAAASTNGARLNALAGSVRTGMFLDPAAAVAAADSALALVPSAAPDQAKSLAAEFRTLKGRALLNAGRIAESRAELRKALQALGGLTLRIDLKDLAVRSDLAIAAMLAKDPDDARLYLAYTGAGRLKGDGLTRAYDMRPAICGEDGVQPDDTAVVEFSIREDGSVGSAHPVYASRQAVALPFARAVKRWSWHPDEVKAIDGFFRSMTRVEVRCTQSLPSAGVDLLLDQQNEAWAAAKGLAPAPSAPSLAAALPALRAELARREQLKGATSADLLPVLLALGGNSLVSREEAADFLRRADGIARQHQAPATMLATIALGQATLTEWSLASKRKHAARLSALAADPAFAIDPIAGGAVRIVAADAARLAQFRDQAATLLNQVAQDGRLIARHPLRVGALIRLASLKAEAGDLASARAAYEQTGLTAQQCALVDAKPALVRDNSSSNDYPMEALRMGFEGWVKTEFDIAADGRTQGVRAIVAYPPFVFDDAATGLFRGARYQQSYRPEGALGCNAKVESVRFKIP